MKKKAKYWTQQILRCTRRWHPCPICDPAIANWAVPFQGLGGWGGRSTGHEKQLISPNFGDTTIKETTIFILIAYSYISKCNNIIFLWHFLSISMLEAMNGAPARWMVPYAQRVLCVQGAAGLYILYTAGNFPQFLELIGNLFSYKCYQLN